jgi:predicted phage terminase large subunit-like protein
VGSRDYTALYQNRPAPEEGNLIKRAFFPSFRREGPGIIRHDGLRIMPPEQHLHRYNVGDLAYSEKQTADYTVVGHFAGHKATGDLFLMDLARARMDIMAEAKAGTHQHFIKSERARAGALYTLVEAKALALGVISDLASAGEPVMGIDADGDKVARAWSARPTMEALRVHIVEYAPWLADFWSEILGFPNTAHDDQVDVLVYGILHWMEFLRGGGVPSMSQNLSRGRTAGATLIEPTGNGAAHTPRRGKPGGGNARPKRNNHGF